ncbi:hypothetical protein [Streptomyces sp. DH10]|uniref:hypothetical protein n=1 Tax=Streptomyces sp. DH10 TaxID=3040121 RepID=UPI002443272B|nr:hypothetical protein [Streptomyces sp. DH10]MDG9709574.1 hypothetical protein [Streptomyces sp. DH10]
MAVTAEELVSALEDARQAHAGVLDRFRADATVTPPGPHRRMLEQQAAQVQGSLQRIQNQVRHLQPRGVLGTAAGVTRWVSRGAVRTAMLPVTVGSRAVRGILPGGGPADPRQVLRNTEDEYAAAARALAACRAGEVVAEQVDDQATAELFGSLRRQDEELMQALQDGLAEQARRAVASVNGSGGNGGDVGEATVQTMRTAADRAREAARRAGRRAKGAAEGAVRETSEPGSVAEEVVGAVQREEDLPIHGFSQLSTDGIRQRLRALSQADLTVVEGYERAHGRRKGVLEAIERLREAEPWAGYDSMEPGEVTARLQDASPEEARQVREYEQRHRQSQEIISAADARMSG